LIGDLEPEQVVCLTWSRAAAERVAAECGGAFIHGGVAQADRHGLLDLFKRGHLRVLVGTLATLGEGVDGLQVARHMIRLDRDWTPARNDQAVARLRRSGQKRAVVVHDIVAHDTIDAVVERALRVKQNVIESVLDHLGR
jgi:SNF2 family DNA or RNA helicase